MVEYDCFWIFWGGKLSLLLLKIRAGDIYCFGHFDKPYQQAAEASPNVESFVVTLGAGALWEMS